ncbi:MAG: hypothetical protein E6Q59_02210 [Nitrosomonas sp.]|nr:hypothetical protein [Nitrosomonas sp.]TXI41374.1 MAG: hypothetical protein E6Q59_02210 [Nitrosomonas sp.]
MKNEEMIREVFIKLMDRIEIQSKLVDSWAKHLITSQSAFVIALGFLLKLDTEYNSLKVVYIVSLAAISVASAYLLKEIIVRQLQWEGEYIKQLRKLEAYDIPAIFERVDIEEPFEGKGFVARKISFFFEIISFVWIVIAVLLIAFIVISAN